MRPGTAVTVTWGRHHGRKGVTVTPPDSDGVVTVRLGSPADWPFSELASVMVRYLKAAPKPDPMDLVGEALV
jgi:hypothetical protein